MKVALKYAQVRHPLFLAGTNLGDKLPTSGKPSKLWYDTELEQLHVVYNEAALVVPHSNIASMEPMSHGDFQIDLKAEHPLYPKQEAKKSPAPSKPIKAQVEAPHDKVQNPPSYRTVK